MKYDDLKRSAEQINMPDGLKTRILDQCNEISANEKRSGISHNEVSGVERVQSHPIRRTFTAAAACAVLAAGVGTGIHFMPKNVGSESAAELSKSEDLSETENSTLPEGFEELFKYDFHCESSAKLTDEQRNDIKIILSTYEWTEISQEEFGDSADEQIYYIEYCDDQNESWEIVFYTGKRAAFTHSTVEKEETTYYNADSENIVEKIQTYLSSDSNTELPDNAAVPPLAGIAEREYMELGYSSTNALSEEQRLALDKLVSETKFTLMPDCSAVYSIPAYFFTDADADSMTDESPLTYFYSNGTAEVREYGQKWFYEYDFDAFSKGVDEILFPDSIYTGADLVCKNMLSENVALHAQKVFEDEPLTAEGKQAVYDFLSSARFRKVDDFDDIQNYICNPASDAYDRELGFDVYSFFCNDSCWAMHFYDCGKLEIIDYSSGEQQASYYIFDNIVGLDKAVHDAFPEISSSYPLFGTLYKMGDIQVNGNLVGEKMRKRLSNAFFGYDYSNGTVSDSFLDKEPVYTIEADIDNINTGTLTIRVYDDGTLEYNDTEGRIHTFEKLGFPETMGEPLLNFEIKVSIDPDYY